ncbi:MBL fold metallo-hydrolase [Schaalia naturae]|uniref:MBL fold metallo-hydrolase n=1 Tax=Schaalia naturae TaxID=635203 RepID=A0ABW2SJU2_9ACTO
MRLFVLPTPFFGANCLIIAPDGAREVVVVDPSHGVLDRLRGILDGLAAAVGAVLCTHGHPDHVWDAAEAARWGLRADAVEQVPVWAPGPDLPRFEDPLAGVGTMAPQDMDLVWEAPADLREMPAGAVELVPAVRLRMVPAPGHTEGSAVFLLDSDLVVVDGASGEVLENHPEPGPWALSGDVIFRDSVGRTDLPGGDETQMRHTLRTLANALDPATVLVPGHGPLTTMRRELAVNPYLRRARRLG